MIKREDVKKGNSLVCVRGGVKIIVGTIVGEPDDNDMVYYQAHGDGMMYQVSFGSIQQEYSIEHSKEEVKKPPVKKAVRHFSNRVSIMRRLNRI